jgi:hypothetical protein
MDLVDQNLFFLCPRHLTDARLKSFFSISCWRSHRHPVTIAIGRRLAAAFSLKPPMASPAA